MLTKGQQIPSLQRKEEKGPSSHLAPNSAFRLAIYGSESLAGIYVSNGEPKLLT
jgi:hypothetical protein